MVPKSIVSIAMIIRILFIIKAEVLFINNKFRLCFFVGDFTKNIKKPKPVVKKKISKIMRREGEDRIKFESIKISLVLVNLKSLR